MKSEMERVPRPKYKARESYNIMSRWYDLFTSSEKRFTDIGIQMLDAQSNESILEIGCGTGYALVEFARKGGRVVAIDLSEKMLQVARRKVRSTCIGLCQADGLSIPFPDNSFDAIFISFTLELFDTPEIPNALKEYHRTLKPDGRIGIVSLAKQETAAVRIYEWFHRKMPTFIDCRPIYLQRILKEAGFQVRESTIKKMWGLPVEIVIAKKGENASSEKTPLPP